MTNIERLVELEKTLDALIAKARASSNPNATLLVLIRRLDQLRGRRPTPGSGGAGRPLGS